MATRPIVPRANGEGSLGVNTAGAEKYWGGVFTQKLNGADANAIAGRSIAIMREANKAVLEGACATAEGLPVNFQLKCTVSGTTANADITLPSTIADGVVFTDGTVTWTVQEIATQNGLGYRQPSTAYTAGQIAYHSALQTGWYLECTTAGTSDSGDLTINSPYVGKTVSDGTVVWTIYGEALSNLGYVTNLNDAWAQGVYKYYSTAQNIPNNRGGVILVLNKETNHGKTGSAWTQIAAPDKDSNESAPLVYIRKCLNNNTWTTWQQIDTIVAKSLAENGYIKYASGLIIQWRNSAVPQGANGTGEITLPISFTTRMTAVLTPYSIAGALKNANIQIVTSTDLAKVHWVRFDSVAGYAYVNIIAIGY